MQLHRLARRRGAAAQRLERRAPRIPVDRPAVVGIDERQVDELVALVDVGHARHGELEQQLAERRALARRRDLGHERREGLEKRAVREQRHGEALHALLPGVVLVDPVRVALGLAQRLLDVAREPIGRDRPHADEGLEDEVALLAVRRPVVDELVGELIPAPHARRPALGHRAQRADPCTGVARALRVVRLRDEQVLRETAARARGSRRGTSSTDTPHRPGSPPTSLSASSRT